MKNWVPSLLFFTLVLATAITLACGSGNRQLDSVSLTPSTADAKTFPDGQLPFTATGYYSAKPSPVTPFSATWGACTSTGPTLDVTVTSAAVAQCAPGASGTYTVWAFW